MGGGANLLNALFCIVEVCAGSTKFSSVQNVSYISLAGCPFGKFKLSNIWKSSSICLLSRTSNPILVNISSIFLSSCAIGWEEPFKSNILGLFWLSVLISNGAVGSIVLLNSSLWISVDLFVILSSISCFILLSSIPYSFLFVTSTFLIYLNIKVIIPLGERYFCFSCSAVSEEISSSKDFLISSKLYSILKM